MARREYKGAAVQTTLASGITIGATSLSLTEYTGWPTGSFTMIIDPGLSSEEKILCTSRSSGTVTITTRGYDDTAASAHSGGAICYPAPTAKDFDEANSHVNETTTAHGLTLANVVTTASSGVVTSAMITNDTIVNADVNSAAAIAYSKLNLTGAVVSGDLANDTIVNADINTAAAIDWTKLAISSSVDSTEIGYVNGVTSAIQTQLDSKLATATASSTYAPLASPALTGVPTAPTAAANTNTTQIATTQFVQTELTDLIGGAPGALDTLNELAAALANDASYSTTITTALGTKLPLAGGTMTGAIAMGTSKITGMGDPTLAQDAATKNYVDTITVAPSNLTGPITSVGSATSIASQTGTGTKFVVDTSPTLVTPVLGVATATSVNGTTIPSTKTLVVTTDKISALAATTSSELAGVISDETGSGALVFATAPTISGLTLSDASIVFEGATADAFETTLTVTDPTADRTITLPNLSGLVPVPVDAGTSGQVLQSAGAGAAPTWAAAAGGGKVLQVVQGTFATETDNATSTYVDTGLTVTITPSLSTSKVLVIVSIPTKKSAGNANNAVNLQLLRDATSLLVGAQICSTGTAIVMTGQWAASYLDSPSTTSATTYKVQFNCAANASYARICESASMATIIVAEIGV